MQNGYPPTPYQTPPQSASQQAPAANVPPQGYPQAVPPSASPVGYGGNVPPAVKPQQAPAANVPPQGYPQAAPPSAPPVAYGLWRACPSRGGAPAGPSSQRPAPRLSPGGAAQRASRGL